MTEPMTFYETISLCISVAGFAAVIITLFLLMRQTKAIITQTTYLAESLKTATYQSVASQIFEVDKILIEHPELRAYFYSDKYIEKNSPHYERVIAVSDLLLDYFDTVLLQMRHFPQVWPRQWWETYIKDTFTHSPILREHLISIKGWYTEELVHLMDLGQKEQRSGKDNTSSDPD
jgi:hypothetical protein